MMQEILTRDKQPLPASSLLSLPPRFCTESKTITFDLLHPSNKSAPFKPCQQLSLLSIQSPERRFSRQRLSGPEYAEVAVWLQRRLTSHSSSSPLGEAQDAPRSSCLFIWRCWPLPLFLLLSTSAYLLHTTFAALIFLSYRRRLNAHPHSSTAHVPWEQCLLFIVLSGGSKFAPFEICFFLGPGTLDVSQATRGCGAFSYVSLLGGDILPALYPYTRLDVVHDDWSMNVMHFKKEEICPLLGDRGRFVV
jgi:hypothetical protein